MAIDLLGGRGGNLAPFGVDGVGLGVVLGHRGESIQADVQGHLGKLDPLRGQASHELGGKVQSGGGGGRGARLAGIHRLVALRVS